MTDEATRNRIRVSIVGDLGTVYSWIETDEYWDAEEFARRYGLASGNYGPAEIADNAEPIYGLLEGLGQSDDAPFMRRETIVGAQIRWLGGAPEYETKIELPRP